MTYGPEDFHKFPFNDADLNWNIHRIGEHHFVFADIAKYGKEKFLLHRGNDIFIPPDSIQRMLERMVTRGRMEQGKADALSLDNIMKFKDADPVAGIYINTP